MMASPIMPRFEYSNPPEHFREVFKQVCALAKKIARLPRKECRAAKIT